MRLPLWCLSMSQLEKTTPLSQQTPLVLIKAATPLGVSGLVLPAGRSPRRRALPLHVCFTSHLHNASPTSRLKCATDMLRRVLVTLVQGATDVHVFAAGEGSTSFREDCALATHTASGGVASASCAGGFADETSAFVIEEARVSLTPVPVQVSDNFKASGAGSLRMSLGGVAVSALAIIGTACAMLVRM